MNTEPPVGDDLARMLVSMKQNVLENAAPRRARRARRVGIVVAIIAFVGIGTASGAVALGMVPNPVAAPAPTASAEPSRAPSPVASATFTPEPTPTPTSTRRPFDRTVPGTWTISGSEVGPIALGAPYAGEIDDLPAAYTRYPNGDCPNPNVSFWDRADGPMLVVTEADGVVTGVSVGLEETSDPSNLVTSPTTAEGAGVGSTLDELRARYPDLQNIGSYGPSDEPSAFSLWSIERNGYAITFEMDVDGARVASVWDGVDRMPPYEFCG